MKEFDCKLRCSGGYWTVESPFGQVDLGDAMQDMIDMNPELKLINAIECDDEDEIEEIKKYYPQDYEKHKKFVLSKKGEENAKS